ncbi:MAG TPA: hypothetical protein VJ937_05375 [Salinivirga sp.]|uniref:hypothetical protein n=1 Tax=Salinivirga sp. TaxID=1970192 RepID=UPI002B4A3338|nr:hypothetical protein [Salinivirga sp.]HKK58885.1 hypothetical protein [Salinivirga sp.]
MKGSFVGILVILFIAGAMFKVHAQNAGQNEPAHLFHDEEPPTIQANVLITDDRTQSDTLDVSLDFRRVIQQHLRESFPAVKFVFVQKMRELKRSGDHVNIMISVKYSGIESATSNKIAMTHYHVTVYDVSRTPIHIKDGAVKYDKNNSTSEEKAKAVEYTVTVANKRLVAFLKRNIKHRTFQKTAQNI